MSLNLQKESCTYTSCYCEENVYKLTEKIVKESSENSDSYKVLFLSNQTEAFPIWKMRLGDFVMWDYHVTER